MLPVITQTDDMSACRALSATATFYSATCIVSFMYGDNEARLSDNEYAMFYVTYM